MFLKPVVKRHVCGGRRMKNKKKIMAVAAGILAALLLAGCAGGGADASPAGTDDAAAAAESAQQEDENMANTTKKPGMKVGIWYLLSDEMAAKYEYGALDAVSYTPAEPGKPAGEIKWAFFQIYEHMANGGYLFDFDKNMVYAVQRASFVKNLPEDFILTITDEEVARVRELIETAGMDTWSGEYNYSNTDGCWYITLLYEDGSQVRAGGSGSDRYKLKEETPAEYSVFLDEIEALMDEVRENNKISESE
jgi:hypothetical protein